MQLTDIEWCRNVDGTRGYSSNPVKGLCPVQCQAPGGYKYCYAAGQDGLYHRFRWNPVIDFDPAEMSTCAKAPPGSKVFVGSTIELFGPWVRDEWMEGILRSVHRIHWVIFIFLTKRPWELPKWNPWPDNAWVGASLTNSKDYENTINCLGNVQTKCCFLSIEPLLWWNNDDLPEQWGEGLKGIHQVIIGAMTGRKAKQYRPKIEWGQEIMEAADRAGNLIFFKDNLLKLYPELPMRQEFPK